MYTAVWDTIRAGVAPGGDHEFIGIQDYIYPLSWLRVGDSGDMECARKISSNSAAGNQNE